MEAFNLLPDPQTNGGLLISVKEEAVEEVKEVLKNDLFWRVLHNLDDYFIRDDSILSKMKGKEGKEYNNGSICWLFIWRVQYSSSVSCLSLVFLVVL